MKHLFITTSMLFWAIITFGQLTGIKNIPGDYANLEVAINDLNLQGVGPGGVTLNLVAGNPQTAPAGGYVITASGNPNSPVLIKGNGNTITSSNALTIGAINDAFFKIIGGDYITIEGFVMQEDPANTTTAASTNNMTEFGIALFYASPTDGPQHCTIQNNSITLGADYQNAMGVYANSRHNATSMTVVADITSANGAFNNLRVLNNTISSVNLGIVLVGSNISDYMTQDVEVSGNHITYGRTGSFSGYVSVSGTVNGIYINNTLNVSINNNTLVCNGTNTAGTLRGIYHNATGTLPTTGNYTNTYNGNIITLTNGTNTATYGIHLQNLNAQFTTYINGNTIHNLDANVSTSAAFYGIYHEGAALHQYIQNNEFYLTPNTTGSVYVIHGGNTLPANGTQTVSGNYVHQLNKTGGGGTVYGYFSYSASPASVVKTITNNTIENVDLTGATTFYGIYELDGGSPTKTISNNTIQNITGGTSQIIAINLNYGIHHVFNNTIRNITNNANITAIAAGGSNTSLANTYNNVIDSLSSSSGSVTGINVSASASGATSNVYKNHIYNLSADAATSSVSGISVSAGTDVTVYNNFISELYTPNASNSTFPVMAGIAVLGGTNVNLYYNTIYLDATSTGTDFSTCALFASTSPANLRINNNIFVNMSTPNGTGIAAAFRRAETSLTKYNSLSSNNCFYAGTLSPNSVLYYDGTNAYQNINDFQTAVAPRETGSIDVLPPFINVITQPYDLHIQTSVATGIESGAIMLTGINDDYDGDIRWGEVGYLGAGTAPDIGADEFNGIPNFTCTSPVPGNTLASSNPACFDETITLSLENTIPGTGVSYQWQYSTDGNLYQDIIGETNPALIINFTEETYYRCLVTCQNGPSSAYSNPIFVTFANEVQSTIPGSRCGVGTVTLEATGNPGSTIFWYDAPIGGNQVGTGSPFTTPVLSSTTSYYASAVSFNNKDITIGTGTNLTGTTSYPSAFGNYWYQTWHQFVIRASELQAQGFTAGYIHSISFNISTLPNPNNPASDYRISLGTTSDNTLTTWQTSGLTLCYGPAAPSLQVGWNTLNFSTPFYWDGTSNILIDIKATDNYGSGNAQTYYTTTTGNTMLYAYSTSNNPNFWNNNPSPNASTSRFNVKFNVDAICSSPRVEVVATINSTTPITITNDTTVCNNETVLLEVTSGAAAYDEFIWSPQNNLYTDAACTVPYTGTSAQQVYLKTDQAGIYTYTCTANNTSNQCSTFDNTTITVLPSTVSLTASPSQLCQSGSSTITASPDNGWGNATFQWYESNDGNNWTPLAGETNITLTTPVINTNMYYQFAAMINTTTCVQNSIEIQILNPQLTSTTGATICGSGSAIISATPNNQNTSVLWYDSLTGVYPIASGENFTTPVITTTTSYYAQPVIESATFNVGKLNDPAGSLSSYGNNGMYFATTDAVIINSVEFYPSTEGTLNVALVNNLSQVVDVRTFTITSSDISTTNKKILTLDFFVPENTTGWMLYYDLAIYRGAGTYAYPYNSNGFSITGNTYDGNNITGGTRMYFYNWQVTSLCSGAKEEVAVVVTPAPAVTITPSANDVCAGTSITLTASSSNTNYTYTWSNQATGSQITVNPTSSTMYSVTASDAQSGCVTTADINLNIYPLPTATATANPTTITCGEFVSIAAGETYSPEILLETFNGTTHTFTAVNNSTGGNPAAAAWTVQPDGYVYGGNTFHSNDNSSFIISNSDAQGSGGTTNTELVSSPFSSLGVDSITIQMYHYYRHYGGSSAKVEIFDGTQWTTLQTWTTSQGAANNFALATIPIPNTYLNNPALQIRFVYNANWGYYWAIDNPQVNLYYANTFSWTSQPVGFTSTSQNNVVAPSVTTDYIVEVTSYHGCTSTAQVTVNVNNMPAPVVTVTNECGQSQLEATNYQGTLNWSTGESTEIITVTNSSPVTVYYTYANCVSDMATVHPAPIEIPNAPTVSNIDACFGETVPTFSATSNYNDFIWYSDAQLTNQIGTGATYQSSETQPGTYTYYVVAVNNGCNSQATEATLTIHSLPTVTISQNGDTLFSSVQTGNQWYNSQGPIAGATDNYFVVTNEDDYYVIVTDAYGCSAASNIIHVIPTAIASQQIAGNISVHPNPAHSSVNISLGKLSRAIVQLIAADGRILIEEIVNSSQQTISLAGVASGVYTVRIISGEQTFNKKLIIE